MRAFWACYLGEVKKLSLKKKYIILIIVSVAICALFAVISSAVGRLASISDGVFWESVALTVMPVFTQLVMPLIAMMGVCDLFASEFSDLSIKAQLMRPVTRFKIYAAKLCAVFSVCAAVFLSVFAVSAVCDAALDGGQTAYAFGAYLINLVALIPVIFMSAVINQITKGSTSAMFLCIIVYILMRVAGIMFPLLDSLLFTGYLSWHKLWMPDMLPIGALASKCALLAGYAVTFFSGGYYLFLKREF